MDKFISKNIKQVRSPSKAYKLARKMVSIEKPAMESKFQNWTNIGMDEDIMLDLEEDGLPEKKQPKVKSSIVKLKSISQGKLIKRQKVKASIVKNIGSKAKKTENPTALNSDSTDKQTKTSGKKKGKVPTLNSLVPLNLFEEKKAFFSNPQDYNPMFKYSEPEVAVFAS